MNVDVMNIDIMNAHQKNSKHCCIRWALRDHLTSPCHDFASGGLKRVIIHMFNHILGHNHKLNIFFRCIFYIPFLIDIATPGPTDRLLAERPV